jgi:hypothetical protein
MTSPSSIQSGNDPSTSIFGPRHLTQAIVLICIALGCLLFSKLARWVGFPTEHFKASLLQSPMEVGALLAGIIALGICAAIGDLILGRRWFLAGLFVATASLATWSVRGGPTQYVLLRADSTNAGRGVFAALLVEHLILMAAVAGLWIWMWAKHSATAIPAQIKDNSSDRDSRSTGSALLAQIGATLLILLILLGETAVKKQVLVSVFLAGMGGTAVSQAFFATSETARWYWLGPAVAGVVGYLAAFIQPSGLEIGHLNGFLIALARPLPLDYASLGTAGALLGYWVNGLIADEESEPVTTAPQASGQSRI